MLIIHLTIKTHKLDSISLRFIVLPIHIITDILDFL